MGGVRDESCLLTHMWPFILNRHDLDEVGEGRIAHFKLKIGSSSGWAGDGARDGLDQGW